MENRTKTQQEIEQEILELNEQFATFLHTKGIKAKFKLAFNNISESAEKQHAADVAEFEAIKAKSVKDNKEFAEFLRAKGIKAKYKLVVENIKKGIKDAPANTAKQIANAQGKTQQTVKAVNASTLEDEFNSFLKSKGLDNKYIVTVTEN